MNFRQQVFMLLTSFLSVGMVVYLIRRSLIDLRYCLLWLLAAFSLVLFALFPQFLTVLSQAVGIMLPVNMLFMLGFYFLAAIVFSLLVIVSRHSLQIKTLSQEVAILKVELARKKEEDVHANSGV